jgi:hypothetical protein
VTPSRPPSRRASLLNIISLLFFVAALGVVTVLVAAMLTPPPVPEINQMPTVAPDLPTATDTLTHTPLPTATASLPASFTPRPTNTPTPTASATATPPTPSSTPSNTHTPTATHTPTETPIPFPFVLRGEVVFRENFANTLGCAWQGIGGAVFADNGAELEVATLNTLRVQVAADNFERSDRPGSNSFYGAQSGYEIAVDTRVNDTLYYVRLENAQGVQISPEIQVTFPASCDGNLAVIEWATNPRFAP